MPSTNPCITNRWARAFLVPLAKLLQARQEDQHRQHGAVLIIVLLSLGVLAVLAVEAARNVSIDHAGGVYLQRVQKSSSLLASGELLAKQVLIQDTDDKRGDNFFEPWNDFSSLAQQASREFVSGSIDGSITDEQGLFPLNALLEKTAGSEDIKKAVQYGEIFTRLTARLCTEHGIQADPARFLESIRCWLGSKTGCEGGDEWYASLKESYLSPKRDFLSLDELGLVYWEGVTKEEFKTIYEGTASVPGLKELVTVWGLGPINMNTAPKEIVLAVAPGDNLDNREEYVAQVTGGQKIGETDFANPAWYEVVVPWVGLDPKKFPKACLGVTSDTYRVEVTARVVEAASGGGTESRQLISIVENRDDGIHVVFRSIQ